MTWRFWLGVTAGFAAGYGVARVMDQRAKQAALAAQARAGEAEGAFTVTPATPGSPWRGAPRALPPVAYSPATAATPDSSPPISGLEEVGLDEYN